MMRLSLHPDAHSYRNVLRQGLWDPVLTRGSAVVQWKLFLLTCPVRQSFQGQPEDREGQTLIKKKLKP